MCTSLGHRSATLTLDTYAHALPDEEYDLSYLPEAGAGTNRHSAGTKPAPTINSEVWENVKVVDFNGARDRVRTGDPQLGKRRRT
jgi:hypothetical protein